jgi:hypothetical protein
MIGQNEPRLAAAVDARIREGGSLAAVLGRALLAVEPDAGKGLLAELQEALRRRGSLPPGEEEAGEVVIPASDPGSDWRHRPELIDGLLPRLLEERCAERMGKAGQVFTPPELARRCVSLLNPAPGQRWLDPAAGTGALLRPLSGTGTQVHALEADPLLLVLGRRLQPWVCWQSGDALAAPGGLPSDWPAGFDRVILNPPFGNGVENGDSAWRRQREDWRARFVTAAGTFDRYIPFVQRACELLRPGGELVAILPDKWLAADYGKALRRWLAAEMCLLGLLHAPGIRCFADGDFELLVLHARRRPADSDPSLRVERLGADLRPLAGHEIPAGELAALAEEGWGPLLKPPARRLSLVTGRPALGETREIAASLTTAEYYQLRVVEARKGVAGLGLLSSGAIDPFRVRWGQEAVRFRKALWQRPLVLPEDLPAGRRAQVNRPRVLLANLSRRLEAVAAAPGCWLGVVNVIQIFCADEEDSHRLAAWLNSPAVDEWLAAWADPLRLSGQLALGRGLVARLPEPPGGAAGRRLAELGRQLAGGGGGSQALLELAALAEGQFRRGPREPA